MDEEKIEIIKKLLEERIKLSTYLIDIWQEEKLENPNNKLSEQIVAAYVREIFAFRTVLDWLTDDDVLRCSAARWLHE